MIRFNLDRRGKGRARVFFFFFSEIFPDATIDFRAQCRALSARMQKANWNGRKTCVAVTVHTYRLSSAVLLASSSSRFELDIRFTRATCTRAHRINGGRMNRIIVDLGNRRKLREHRKEFEKLPGDFEIFHAARRIK